MSTSLKWVWFFLILLPVWSSFAQRADSTIQNLSRAEEFFPMRFDQISVAQGLSHSTVNSILQDQKGFMWMGTFDGLNRFDGHRFVGYKHDPLDSSSLGANVVWSICEDRTGVLWVGTDGGGLNRFCRATETFTRYQHDPGDPTSLSSNRIRCIFEDRAGVLWVGTMGGLNKLVLNKVEGAGEGAGRPTATFTRYYHDPAKPNSLSSNTILSICEDKSGVLFLGTDGGGLNVFDRGKDIFESYQYDPADPHSLSSNVVPTLYEDRDGVLWVGTSRGLDRFDRSTGTFLHFRLLSEDLESPDHINYNHVLSILEDDHGNLWLSTNKGLSKFNPRTERFDNYDINDGLQGDEYNSRACYWTRVRI